MEVMSEQFDTEEAFYNDAKQWLSSVGVSNPTVGQSGRIPVNPGNYSLISAEVSDETSKAQSVLNEFPRDPSGRMLLGEQQPLGNFSAPLCNVLGCGILDLLPRECSYIDVEWNDPDIRASAVPSLIPNAKVFLNPFNARIVGEVQSQIQNSSEPGEKTTQEIFKCDTSKNGEKATEVLENSSSLDIVGRQRFTDIENGEFIEELVQESVGLGAGARVTNNIEFEKSGGLSTIKGIFDVWSTGTVKAEYNGTLRVSYNWKNSRRTKELGINTRARVPVNNLDYGW